METTHYMHKLLNWYLKEYFRQIRRHKNKKKRKICWKNFYYAELSDRYIMYIINFYVKTLILGIVFESLILYINKNWMCTQSKSCKTQHLYYCICTFTPGKVQS
jgi:hypothetical protein